MTKLQRRSMSAAQLVSTILDTPELMRAVQQLPAPALAALIEQVGLEDAGELVTLSSQDQLQSLLDADLWQSEPDGLEERFRPERFGLWLAIMNECGEAFTVRCLTEMPVDQLILGVQKLTCVLNLDELAAEDDEVLASTDQDLARLSYEEWEEFALVPRAPDHWDSLWTALLTLDRDHHDLLRKVLEHCAYMSQVELEEHGGLLELLSEEAVLEDQVREERGERRAAAGFVAAGDAVAFMALARQGQVLDGPDPITQAYHRRLDPITVAAPAPSVGRADRLLALLQEANVIDMPAETARSLTKRLPAADSHPRQGLMALLPRLQREEPSRQERLAEELSYLVNVLIALPSASVPVRPVDALSAVVTLCDLGLEACCEQGQGGTDPWSCLLNVPADQLLRAGVQRVGSAPGPHRADSSLQPFWSWLAAGTPAQAVGTSEEALEEEALKDEGRY